MGIFNRNFDRPGPGVSKDAPRKKGAARYFEVLGRDWGSFWKASLLCLLGYIPWGLLTGVGLLTGSLLFALAGGLVGGAIAGPALAGLHDTVLRALRDEPGYWWHVYKRAFKNNWRAALAPGALLGFLTAGQAFLICFLLMGTIRADLLSTAMLTLNLLLTGILDKFGRTLVYSEAYGFWGLTVLMLWQQAGSLMIIYISGLTSIPGELIEAAEMDGANGWQVLTRVKLPMIMPSITICTFLTLTNGFKLFDQNLALTNGMPSSRSELLALNIYNTFYGRTGWAGAGQAKAVVFCIIVVAIALIQLRATRSKEVQQ